MKKLMIASVFLLSVAANGEDYYPEENTGNISYSLGLGSIYQRSLYKTKDKYEVHPFFPVSVEYNDFYLNVGEMETGYHIFREGGFTLSVIGRAHTGYDSDDLKREYRSMDNRNFDFHSGIKGSYTYENMEFNSFITSDISGESDGKTLGMEAKVHHQIIPGKLILTPSAGVTYVDSHYADYFYGVKGREAAKIDSIDGEYRGAGSVIYNIGSTLTYIYDANLSLSLIGGVDFYDSKIKNSPIVEKDTGYYVGGIFVYRFK